MNNSMNLEKISFVVVSLFLVLSVGAMVTMKIGGTTESSGSSSEVILIKLSEVLKGDIISLNAQSYNNTWLNFDWTDYYIKVNNNSELSIANSDYTISFWIKPITSTFSSGASSGYTEFLGKGDAGQHEYSFRLYNSTGAYPNALQFVGQSLGGSSASNTRLTPVLNEWNFITATKNSSHISIYLNGELEDRDTYSITMEEGIENLNIGTKRGGSSWFNGSLDNIIFYNKSLDEKSIKKLYREGILGSNYGIGIPVLSFHQVITPANSQSKVTPDFFNQTITWLDNQGFETITYKNYYDWKNGEYKLPNKPLLITFDDGSLTDYTTAFPIMQEHNFIANDFIVTNRTNNPNDFTYSMNWTHVKALKNAGWLIGSHTHTNKDLLTLSESERLYELNTSKFYLTQNLGTDFFVFQYVYNSNNDTTDTECSQYYNICNGFGSVDIETRMDTYLYKRANLTHESGSPIGTRRNSMHNYTTLEQIINLVSFNDNITLHLKLNENQETTAYDSSTNQNDGTIYNPLWENDNSLVNLTNAVDYVLSGATFTILNSAYSWSWINVTYDYVTNSNPSSNVGSQIINKMVDWAGIIIILALLPIFFILLKKQRKY